MNPFRTMLLSTAVFGLCAGAVPAQDPGKEPPRPEEVIRILEKVRAQLAEKDLTPEQRQKLAEVLARTTAQIERAVDGDAERRDRERAAEREMRDAQRQMEEARRQIERQQAEMQREMANRQRELDRAREQLERELVKREVEQDKLRQELERAHAESAAVRDSAEAARRQAEEARQRAMQEVDRAEAARRDAEEARHRAMAADRAMSEARRARDEDRKAVEQDRREADRVRAEAGQAAPRGIAVVRSSRDGQVVKGQVVRLDDVTESKSSGGEHDVWIVKRGDTVAGIAQQTTGEEGRWQAIVEANPHIDPSRLHVGGQVRVPAPPKAPAAPPAPARYRFFPGSVAQPPHAPPAPAPVEHHVHTHVHHHYDGPAPAPVAAPQPGADVSSGGRVHHVVPPAPKAGTATVRATTTQPRTAVVRSTVRQPRATTVRAEALPARATAARADDIRKMVDGLRKELRETRAMVEELRKKLTDTDAPAARIH